MELKHIVGYLPYGLKCICESTNHKDDNFNFALEEISTINGVFAAYEWYSLSGACIKPILRPLSDLTKEIEVNGEMLVPAAALGEYYRDYPHEIEQDARSKTISLWHAEKLYEWQFDLHSLIEKREAIDINQLKNKP